MFLPLCSGCIFSILALGKACHYGTKIGCGNILQDEPTHLILCSNFGGGSILPIIEDRTGVANFPEKIIWDEVFTGYGRFVHYVTMLTLRIQNLYTS